MKWNYPVSLDIGGIRDYDNKIITISGEVIDRTSLLFLKYFKLKDKTGEIVVVTDRALPVVGSKVRVKGRIEEAFTIGATSRCWFLWRRIMIGRSNQLTIVILTTSKACFRT